jgi:hypothetical protein
MYVRVIEFTYFYDFSIECWNCSDSVIYIFSFYYRLWKKPAELQLLKKIWLWSSSVIKIVEMKYNRIDIKWWLVSTSLKNSLNLYITFTIFYYNTISLKCTVFSCSSKRTLSSGIIQFTCNAVNTHLNHRRIFLFFIPCGVGVAIVHAKY